MSEPVTHEVILAGGYVDGKNVRHNRVVFGHRITARDLFAIDRDPQGQLPTQYQDLLISAHIIEFGSLPMPVSLLALLSLDSIDHDDLVAACNEYQDKSAEQRSEFLPEFKVKLAFGFIVNDILYDMVQFGRRLTGVDHVAADREKLEPGFKRACFLAGRQISEIATACGTLTLPGPIPLEYFESLDAADVATLQGGAEMWRQSFRVNRGNVSPEGGSQGSGGAGSEVRVDRGANTESAGRPAQ
jgi:hypothetical protein